MDGEACTYLKTATRWFFAGVAFTLASALAGVSMYVAVSPDRPTGPGPASAAPSVDPWLEELLAAIRSVEGDDGRTGEAGELGPYRCTDLWWTDADAQLAAEGNPWAGVARDPWANDERIARIYVLAYWRKWAPEALAAGDVETLARIHRGGPNGATTRRHVTDEYWRRVSLRLQKGREP